jgi:hypothetical protein
MTRRESVIPPVRPSGAAGPHAWENSRRGWEALLVASLLVPSAFILLGDMPAPRKAAEVGLLLAMIAVYVWIGRPAIINGLRRRGVAYMILLVGLFTPAVMLEPATSYALFGLCPQAFLALQ